MSHLDGFHMMAATREPDVKEKLLKGMPQAPGFKVIWTVQHPLDSKTDKSPDVNSFMSTTT
jgi:hypothetical protein